MKSSIQRLHHQCDCGGSAPVRVYHAPYEFAWTCLCGRSGMISWFHGAPPPAFPQPQPTLFEDVA